MADIGSERKIENELTQLIEKWITEAVENGDLAFWIAPNVAERMAVAATQVFMAGNDGMDE